ncbi:MAG: alpha/beta fold hydrolase [Verrucomicrobia bacterium]|nr:alpha/beta fold hydrolase [Verrucomicrobiota bacterium]
MTAFALHGMMGQARDWDCLELDVRAVDLWQAFAEGDCPDLKHWAKNFNAEVKDVDAKMLIGYSMGGRLALHAILDQPEAWRAAVVISAHPGLLDDAERRVRWENDLQWSSLVREKSWPDFIELWNDQETLQSASGSTFQADLERDRESVARAFECWSLGRQGDLRPALAESKTPILWITGERDQKFTRLADEVAASNECIEHVVIPEAGHRLLFENEEPLNSVKSLIGDFQTRFL